MGLNKNKFWNIKNLDVKKINLIKQFLPDQGLFDNELKKKLSIDLDKFLELKCYKRNRIILKLPRNGQRTKTNCKTVKRVNLF